MTCNFVSKSLAVLSQTQTSPDLGYHLDIRGYLWGKVVYILLAIQIFVVILSDMSKCSSFGPIRVRYIVLRKNSPYDPMNSICSHVMHLHKIFVSVKLSYRPTLSESRYEGVTDKELFVLVLKIAYDNQFIQHSFIPVFSV